MRENDVLLETISIVIITIILTFGFYIFFSGHNGPGGGFIGGLVFASAFILMFLTFDAAKIKQAVPINFNYIIVTGSTITLLVLLFPLLIGDAFLTQYDRYFSVIGIGKIHIATVTLFELGIMMVVLGVIMTILLTISGDEQ